MDIHKVIGKLPHPEREGDSYIINRLDYESCKLVVK